MSLKENEKMKPERGEKIRNAQYHSFSLSAAYNNAATVHILQLQMSGCEARSTCVGKHSILLLRSGTYV